MQRVQQRLISPGWLQARQGNREQDGREGYGGRKITSIWSVPGVTQMRARKCRDREEAYPEMTSDYRGL